jgi:tetratricopeptide (TPR) repeat protein
MSANPGEIPAIQREAEAALGRGDRDRAVALLHTARAVAEELAADDKAMLQDYAVISMKLVDLEVQAEQHSAAVQVAAETQASAHRLDAPGVELWAVLSLLSMHLSHGDFKAASSYANVVAPLFAQVDSQDEQVIPPPDRADFYQVLVTLAKELYYGPEDYEAAQTAAEAAIQLLPDEPLGHYFLGLALLALKRYDDAIPTWQRLVALGPDLPFNHVNLAEALSSAGRVEEAVEAMGRALELAPDKARYWFSRGQLNGVLDRYEAAVADFDKVLELAAAAPSEPPPATPPQSRAAYERDMPLQDLADFAAMARLLCLRALGRVDEAIQAAQQIAEERDEVTAQAARMTLGELYESLGRRRDAIDLYTQVLAGDSSEADTHCRRARLYLAENLLDEATDDLAAVADDYETAKDAIPLLTQLLDQSPGHAGARKMLGRAYLTAFLPAKAFEALTAALAALPEDWEVPYWRGLAGISHGDESDEVETAWNSSFGYPRIADAIKDLTEAATRTADPRPATALRWLAERVGAHEQLLQWLSTEIESSGSRIVEVVPELALVPKLDHAGAMGSEGRWQEAADELVLTRARLVDAGLRILAMQADLALADQYLRLYQIQAAIDHLAAAEEGLFLLGIPLDETVRRRAEEQTERDRKSGVPTLFVDFDHLELFGMASGDSLWRLKQLRAQARARVGDAAGAVEMIDESDGVKRLLSDLSETESAPRSALATGTMLRDGGRLDDALAIARQLVRLADNDRDRMIAHNFAATVLERTDDLDGAAEHSRAALALAEGSPEAAAATAGNLAMIQLMRHEPRQALDLVDAYPSPPSAQQPIRYSHHSLRGMALFDLGDYAGAQRELTTALAIQDEARGRLRTYEDRMLWHAQQLKVHDRAVLAAVLNRDWSTALDLTEQFKARAFVDQLAASELPPAAEPDDLREALGRIQARRRLLRQLSVSAQTGYVDHELLRQLAELGKDIDLVEQREDGSQAIKGERLATELAEEDTRAKRLETQIENAKLAAVESIVGTTLSFDQIRGLLGPRDQPARRWRTAFRRSGG